MKEQNSTLVFVHIPKTAGTTLLHIINKKYKNIYQTDGLNPKYSREEFEGFSIEKQNEFEAIIGHLTLSLSRNIENPIFLTYLRNPVDHFISLFHYIKRAESNRFHESVKNMDDILEFINYTKEIGEDNLQTRHLSGDTNHLTDTLIKPKSMSIVGDELLDRAKNNLKRFDYVFHTHQFNKSLIILKNDLNWKDLPFYLMKNRTTNRPKVSSVDVSIRDKISELNKYDVELYEFSKKINQKMIDKYNVEIELARFNSFNHYYQKTNELKNKLILYTKKVLNIS